MINSLVNQRYEALEKIGESALFAVYKVRDTASNRIVALKTVQPAYAADAGFLEGLKAGIHAASDLNHPNITAAQEMGVEDGIPYFVTEFVRGINLKERIRRIAPFTLSVAVDFACAIGEALQYAHSIGQAHGDLRPQNVVISPEGQVRVTDFGVMRGIARSAAAQREALLRSAPYHAPELSTTQPGSVSGDIYALGAILFEMLTSTPLYAARTPEETAEMHAFAPIPSPRAINAGVPRALEGIVYKCLLKRPEERYRSVAELLSDLKAVRDALRFGKPLSWSPIEFEKLAAAAQNPPAAPIPAAAPQPAPMPPAPVSAPAPVAGPVAEVAASSMPLAMPANNSLRAADERVSIYLKIAIGTVTVIIIACLVGFAGIWSSMWVVPEAKPVPQLVGKPIAEARELAQRMGVRLIEHGEYTEKPRNQVYKVDKELGAKIRPGQVINLWYSKGATYVYVPKLTGMTQDQAKKALEDVGLTLGRVTPQYSDKVPIGQVVRQTVSHKKRVFHDTPVDLVISDGPKPDYALQEPDSDSATLAPEIEDETNSGSETGTESEEATPSIAAPSGVEDEVPAGTETYTFDRTISIPQDGAGVRQVRIDIRDARGWQPPIIDELHNEGDKIPLIFDYYGKTITMRIYYDGRLSWEKTFDPQDRRQIR